MRRERKLLTPEDRKRREEVIGPNGMSIRFLRQYDHHTDTFALRLDMLYGFAAVRPEMACRIVGGECEAIGIEEWEDIPDAVFMTQTMTKEEFARHYPPAGLAFHRDAFAIEVTRCP